MHSRLIRLLTLLTLVLVFPTNGVNAQNSNIPCPPGIGPGGIKPGSYPPTKLSQGQRQWLFEIFGNKGIASDGYGGQDCGNQPQTGLRPCPSGTGPDGITPGSYPPTSLKQEQRQWLFNIFGNSGVAADGYGGEDCQGHIPWSPSPSVQQPPPVQQPQLPPVQQQQIQPPQPAQQPKQLPQPAQQPSQPQAPQQQQQFPQPLQQLPTTSSPATTGPSGYTYCASEGQRCNFSDTKDVVYGASGQFNYKTGISGGIDCNNGVFGDPNYGVTKACYVKDSIPQALQPQTVIPPYIDLPLDFSDDKTAQNSAQLQPWVREELTNDLTPDEFNNLMGVMSDAASIGMCGYDLAIGLSDTVAGIPQFPQGTPDDCAGAVDPIMNVLRQTGRYLIPPVE